MKKTVLLSLLCLCMVSVSIGVKAYDGATDYGESTLVMRGGQIDWTASVGEPSNDPFSPESYKNAMGDTLAPPDEGGLGGNTTVE